MTHAFGKSDGGKNEGWDFIEQASIHKASGASQSSLRDQQWHCVQISSEHTTNLQRGRERNTKKCKREGERERDGVMKGERV